MSFREKSAWTMALLMTAAGFFYLHLVRSASQTTGEAAPPPVVAFVFLVVIGSVIAQTVLALSSRKEAMARADERERLVRQRAGNWSGMVLAVGAVLSLGHFMVRADGDTLFHLIVASLIVAQIAEYAFQILLVRRNF